MRCQGKGHRKQFPYVKLSHANHWSPSQLHQRSGEFILPIHKNNPPNIYFFFFFLAHGLDYPCSLVRRLTRVYPQKLECKNIVQRLRYQSHMELRALKFFVDHISPERRWPPNDPCTTIWRISFSPNMSYLLCRDNSSILHISSLYTIIGHTNWI